MTIILRHEVKCDKCGQREFCHDSISVNKTEALEVAAVYGWVRRNIGGRMSDFCPDCQKSAKLFRAT